MWSGNAMFVSLRWRLFMSYLLVLLVTLGVIGAALFIILTTRAAPVEPTMQRLATFAFNISLRDLARQSGMRLFRPTEADFTELTLTLDSVASSTSLRLLLMRLDDLVVLYDSAAQYARGDILRGAVSAYRVPAAITTRLTAQVDAIGGAFTDADGTEWVFVGAEGLRGELLPGRTETDRGRPPPPPARGFTHALIYAAPRPTQNLGEAINEFTAELFPLLIQGAIVGVLSALVTGMLIARSIVRPLRVLADAAHEIARGHYGRQVAVRGARELRDLAGAFNRMSREVHTTQQAQRDFMANVSHDLKTPLTSIQGFSGAIIDGTAPDAVHAARIIYQEAERLNRMVAALTDLARLQAGQTPMQLTAIDMGTLAMSVAGRLAVLAEEKHITLTTNTPPLPPINGDGDRLVQVMTNLIGNAIKYTPAGGHVWVTARAHPDSVTIAIADDGQGIAPAERERIFERFYQVDKVRGPGRGAGLGLAIAQEIVKAHGGRISVESEGEGRGSTFTVWLPLPDAPQTAVRRRAA
jgi:signal transduction histidine kinase